MIGKPIYMSPSATTAGGGIVTDINPIFSFAIDGDEPITGYTINILPQEPSELPDTIVKGFEGGTITYNSFSCEKVNQTLKFTLSLIFNGTFKLLYSKGSFKGQEKVKFVLGIDNLFYVLAGQHVDPYQSSAYYLLSPDGQQAKNGYNFVPTCTKEIAVSNNDTITFNNETFNFTYTFDFSQHNTVRTARGKNACYTGYRYFNNIKTSTDKKTLLGTNGEKNNQNYRAEFYYTSGQSIAGLTIGDYKLFIIQNNESLAFTPIDDLMNMNALVISEEPITIKGEGGNLKDAKGNLKFFSSQIVGSKLVVNKSYRWYIDKILDNKGNDINRASKIEIFTYNPSISDIDLIWQQPTLSVDTKDLFKVKSLTVKFKNKKYYAEPHDNECVITLPIPENLQSKLIDGEIRFKNDTFASKTLDKEGNPIAFDKDSFTDLTGSIVTANHLYCQLDTNAKLIRFIEGEGTLLSKITYDYCYYPNREMYYYKDDSIKYVPSTYDDFWGYSLLLCDKKDSTGYKVQKVYDFQLNINVPSYTNNAQYTTLKNFTPYPFIENTSADYLTGDCQGLIGLVADDCMTYIQKPEILNELAADLINNNYVKLLKMPEGRMLRIQPTSGLSAENNDTHDFKKIKFSWAEIEDVTNGIVYGEKVSAANGKI